MPRCPWAAVEPELTYHDTEWGRPQRDDTALFEMLTLEGAQAGLSWRTILNKRTGYRAAFAGFDPVKVARFTEADVERLVGDAGIVRHRGKIAATVANAGAFLRIVEARGSFADYLWGFVDGRPVVNRWKVMGEVPARTPLAETISKDLRKRGFNFVGPTIVYAYLQAVGVVNDHLVSCPQHRVCAGMR